ncbi:adaptor protein MecA [Anaeropeptidivorans aminofermentans]|jgi:adapter protein MecA 1/2|uniref:adaptor protein MecA n=1 Tax=Anaeropeptidivorans aminofermentans TaxID=2934315 RepID=UPI0020245FC3|nr:adaptor protein MecA [Anaeropeptidivorans aminofermentans]MBE6013505.1 adaptor protein MecA [Lachnospiraceae bacterium]
MRIEKISENQIKFLLSKADLTERDIKITELAYGSEKTQELFREMMEQAMAECGFEAENAPLMIEAIPVTQESIMIIVTKVTGNEYAENKFNLLPRAKEQGKFKKKSLSDFKDDNGKPSIYIYSFLNIDNAIDLSKRLESTFIGESSMYKYNNTYYLILEGPEYLSETGEIEPILNEYGQKHISDPITKYYLLEHGELIVKNPAVQILANV